MNQGWTMTYFLQMRVCIVTDIFFKDSIILNSYSIIWIINIFKLLKINIEFFTIIKDSITLNSLPLSEIQLH